MGKQTKAQTKLSKDPQDHPISKKKTLIANLNGYIRMLKQNFPDMPSKQYIKNVHRFIEKIKRKLKHTDQQKLVQARQKIRVCTTCDCWSGKKPMIQCTFCQDNYHISCLQNASSVKERQSWYCQPCDAIFNAKKSDKNQYLRMYSQQDQCAKCQKQKKQMQTFIICIKCNMKFHKNCYGKSNVVCYKCDQTIESTFQIYLEQIKQKQASLFDYNFHSTTKKKKSQSPTKNNAFSKFGKDQLIDEMTQTSTNLYPNFSKNYPEMTKQQIQEYRNSLLYAIRAKKMTHVEKLMPQQCEIQEDNEESLDFGLMHMNKLEQQVYKKYKAQPFGPFKFVYRQNMGYDVLADKDLPKGMLVCQYIGDVVTYREVINKDSEQHNDSLFELRAGRNTNQTLYIRPQKFTNMGRFINGVNNKTGKNKINVASIRMLANGIPGIFLYTTRKITKGQSLAYDYNAGGLNAYSTEDFL